MNKNLGLRIISHVMNWDEERSRKEFSWLRQMSEYKYDSYMDYLAGAGFVENLITWLQQFKDDEREHAYKFIKEKLIYIGSAEMRKLVENYYPEIIHQSLIKSAAKNIGIPPYTIYTNPKAVKELEIQRRKILFLGLSDGARIDLFRRANVGILSNEQISVTTLIDQSKWEGLLKDLREDLKDNSAKFDKICLIDDFTASGTSLIRRDDIKKVWKGKLQKLKSSLNKKDTNNYLEKDWSLSVHHYLSTSHAKKNIEEKFIEMKKNDSWFPKTEFTYGTVLPEDLPITKSNSDYFMPLVEKYYDKFLENKHSAASGIPSVKYGYGNCALPLVLEHNTPNNSLPIIWADTEGDGDENHAMKPLFRRHQRHI